MEDPIPPGDSVPHITVPFPPTTPIHGKYTHLQPLNASHTSSLYKHLGGPSNASLWTFLPMPAPFTRDAMASIVDQWTTNGGDPQYFAIMSGPAKEEEGEEGNDAEVEAVGVICYAAIFPEHRRIEVAWVIFGNALQRTKKATEVFYLLLDRAFSMGYQRVEWKANSLNAPSLAAANRLGFTAEGIFRKHWIMKGKRRDTAWFSMIDDDWTRVKKGFTLWLSKDNFDESGRQKRGLKECREC